MDCLVGQLDDCQVSGDKMQDPNIFYHYLPYKNLLETYRLEVLGEIKSKLISAIANNDQDLPECIDKFKTYFSAYGYAFSKEEHIFFIKIFYQILCSLTTDLVLITKLVNILNPLLRKSRLISRDELILEWRPLYELQQRVFEIKNGNTISFINSKTKPSFENLILKCRVYFALSATREILDHMKPHFIDDNELHTIIRRFADYVPVCVYPSEHEQAYKLWFENYMNYFLNHSVDATVFLHTMRVYSCLSEYTTGFIDWDQYIPCILDRYFDYVAKNKQNEMCTTYIIRWLINTMSPTSKSLFYYQKLMLVIKDGYIKEKNRVKLDKHISTSLDHFVQRLHKQQHPEAWNFFTQQSHMLNEHICHEFAAFFKNNFLVMPFLANFDLKSIHRLVMIDPKLFINSVEEAFAMAYDKIEEPGRLEFALKMACSSLFPIMLDEELAVQYRPKVLELMFGLVKQVDSNNVTQCKLYLWAIQSILDLGMPLRIYDNIDTDKLGEAEQQLVSLSYQFEEFISDFFNLVINLIESNNNSLFARNSQENSLDFTISSITNLIFLNASQEHSQMFVDRFHQYVMTKITDEKDNLSTIFTVMRVCAMSYCKYTLNKFIVPLCDTLLSLTEDKTKLSEISKSEFLYYLNLLKASVLTPNEELLKYQDKLIEVIRRLSTFDMEESYKEDRILCYLLLALGRTRSEMVPSKANYFDWPRLENIGDFGCKWYGPTREKNQLVLRLYELVINPAIIWLEQLVDSGGGDFSDSNFQLKKNLDLIFSFASMADFFNRKEQPKCFASYLSNDNTLESIDFVNQVTPLLAKLINRMRNCVQVMEVSTTLVLIYREILFPSEGNLYIPITEYLFSKKFRYHYSKTSKRINIHSFHWLQLQYHSQDALSNMKKLLLSKSISEEHTNALELVCPLLASPYNATRAIVFKLLRQYPQYFPCSFELIAPYIVSHLQMTDNFEQQSDSLHLLMYPGSYDHSTIPFAYSLKVIACLWPAFLLLKSFQNPKIDRIISSFEKAYDKLDLIDFSIENVDLADKILNLLDEAGDLGFHVSPDEIKTNKASLKLKNEEKVKLWHNIVESMTDLLQTQKMSWRFYVIGVVLIEKLIRKDSPITDKLVKFYLDNLVHDSIDVRHSALNAFLRILYLKRNKTTQTIPAETMNMLEARIKSELILYGPSGYIQKNIKYGFYPIDYNVSTFTRRPLDESIVKCFSDETYLDKIFEFNSLEGDTAYKMRNSRLWKYLYQTYGLFNGVAIFARIEKLLTKKKYNFDKFAMEAMSGLIKASFTFELDEFNQLKQFILNNIMTNVFDFNSESRGYWRHMFGNMFYSRDMRRYSFVFENLHDRNVFAALSPYFQEFVLDVFGAIGGSNLKKPEVNLAMVSFAEDHLDNEYQVVRVAAGKLLSKLLWEQNNVYAPSNCPYFLVAPICDRFVAKVQSLLSPLLVDYDQAEKCLVAEQHRAKVINPETPEGKNLLHVIESLCSWIGSNSNDFAPFVTLLPYLVVAHQDTLNLKLEKAINNFATYPYTQAELGNVLQAVRLVYRNWDWHARKLISQFFTKFVVKNYFVLLQDVDTWFDIVVGAPINGDNKTATPLTGLLFDEQAEVRKFGCYILACLVSWDFKDEGFYRKLIAEFMRKAQTPIDKMGGSIGLNGFKQKMSNELLVKIGAIEGLCSFVYAHPNAFPNYVCEVLSFLAGQHSGPYPIPDIIRKMMNIFRNEHVSEWSQYKTQFTEDQLLDLTDLLVSPSYYA